MPAADPGAMNILNPANGATIADVPEDGWRLVALLPGPDDPVPWRPEPLRVWERVEDEARTASSP